MDFNNSNILITGGAGFIGSNLVFYFQNKFPGANIVVFDTFRNGDKFENGNLKSFGHYNNLLGFKGDVICGDLINNDDLKILDRYKFDFIFHHAAISDTRVYDQEMVMKTNINSFYYFLDKAKIDNAVLVYASSGATYGSLVSPQTVGVENPENPYGYSKYQMDQIAMRFLNDNPEMVICGLRFFNVYGPGEFFKAKTSSMIIQLAFQILDGKNPKLFKGSEKILRDFVYIEDVIQSNILCSTQKKSGVYNVGTGKPRSFVDIVQILQSELNTSFDIDYFPNPYKGYQMHTQADISNTVNKLGYKPNFTLEDGIKNYMPYILEMHKANII